MNKIPNNKFKLKTNLLAILETSCSTETSEAEEGGGFEQLESERWLRSVSIPLRRNEMGKET